MKTKSVQQRSVAFAAPGAEDGAQQVLKIDIGPQQSKRLPAWFFSGPRVVDLWPPDVRPVWARAQAVTLAAPPMPSSPDAVVDAPAWTQAAQQNTRVWVRQFGTVLGQVNYFQQLQQRLGHMVSGEVRTALEQLLGTPDGTLLFSVLPQLALRSLGHTPLPVESPAADSMFKDGSAVLVWPALLMAPSCCDAQLVAAVQGALSPAALRRLGEFCASDLGTAFLGLLRQLSRDPLVMTADMTVRNNLQAGLRDELQAIHRESAISSMRELGQNLGRDVTSLRRMLADRQDLFLQAAPELDRTLIGLQTVAALGDELRRGPHPCDGGDLVWEVGILERVHRDVPNLHRCVGHLLQKVGQGHAVGPTLAALYLPMTS